MEKEKGYTLESLTKDGRRFEAITVGGERLSNIDKPTSSNIDAIHRRQHSQQECSNCGLGHPPRRCPAFRDKCKQCQAVGHWAKMCRNSKSRDKRPRSTSRHRGNTFRHRNSTPDIAVDRTGKDLQAETVVETSLCMQWT